MVNLSHVYKTYVSDQHILQNLDFDMDKGDFAFLMGPSGAGKTTLFKIMAGFEKVTSGSVTINGYNLNQLNFKTRSKFRRSIGVVFQDFKLLNDRSVYENVSLPLQILGCHRWEILERTEKIIAKVGLKKKINENPMHLSGGEKQRVAIARALVHDPAFLIADEPTGNLDWKLSEEIIDLFKQANSTGTTILIATHDHDILNSVGSKRVVKIDKGQLFENEEEQPCGQYFAPLKEAGLNIL